MKTAVITGGNSGMGKAVAIALAKKAYRIIIHGREAEKTIAAANEIIQLSGNPKVEYVVADVSEIKGMRFLADEIKKKTDCIDALVLSTGVILSKRFETADGLEKGFAIQYLSRFAVTHFLLPELKKGKAKIVLIGATKIRNAEVFFDDLSLKHNFTMVRAMAQEMFCNHLFVQEFAKRFENSGMYINMGHVGIAKTGITRNVNFLFGWVVKLIGKSPEQAARNFVYLAADEGVNFSGYFFKNPGNTQSKEKMEYDPQLAARLYDKSLDLIKL